MGVVIRGSELNDFLDTWDLHKTAPEDFSSSVAYREILGLGPAGGTSTGRQVGLLEGQQEGRQA